MRLVMLLTIPSAIGLMILAQPIIAVIYQHGRFTADVDDADGGSAPVLRDRTRRLCGSESARAGLLRDQQAHICRWSLV